jgi:hypothetical protein
MVLFADDISITITDSNRKPFNINANQMFQGINTWCNISLLTLNFNKTQYLEFRTKNYYNVNTQIKYDQECITNTIKIKFLRLTIDDTSRWKQHIEQVINKMCSACYALRNIKRIAPVNTLRVIHFAHIHSVISCSITFWSSSYYANKVFILQKKIIRIKTNTRLRVPCKKAFKNMKIMTLYSQYMYSLVLHTVNNKHLFDTNNEIHKYKTRNNNNLRLLLANSSKFNKGTYISGIKVFNHLPQYIKALLNNQTYFKSTLKRFLYHHSFYSIN